mmetsp:Transcript_64276/g.188048  ORF Transcript_64276/g.188048 Transcript_64276/m.188048 type:complete len:104 (+) Transcript_64276:1194-1505(+)
MGVRLPCRGRDSATQELSRERTLVIKEPMATTPTGPNCQTNMSHTIQQHLFAKATSEITRSGLRIRHVNEYGPEATGRRVVKAPRITAGNYRGQSHPRWETCR